MDRFVRRQTDAVGEKVESQWLHRRAGVSCRIEESAVGVQGADTNPVSHDTPPLPQTSGGVTTPCPQ